jgi:hypothetical protein
MSNRLVFTDSEIADPEHFTQVGEFAQGATDAVVGGAIAWPAHWARITVAATATPDVVRISAGEYHAGPKIFASSDPIDVNLQIYKPILVSDEHWIALILRGTEQTVAANVSVETSEEPLNSSVPVVMSRPKRVSRIMSVIVQQGTVQPAPALRPAINENDCCIAFVRLKTTGVVEIVANEAGRVKTVFEIDGRLTAVELLIETIIESIATIRTDLTNIAAQLGNVPKPALIAQVVRDTARHNQALNMPEEARNYWFDWALVPDEWDTDNPAAFFRIDEGVRFGFATKRDAQLRLLDNNNPAMKLFSNRLALPAWTEVPRITSPEGAGRQDLANTVHTTVTAIERKVTHQRIRYGETITVCENRAGWESANLKDRRAGETFKVNGVSYVKVGVTNNPWNNDPRSEGGHKEVAVRRVIKDTYTTTYVDYNTEQVGLSGAIFGQTFLTSQLMVSTSIDLFFTRVGTVGDVTLVLCEINAAGAPDFEAVLTKVTLAPSDLSLGWVKFSYEPTLLDQGRHAWFTVTTGNHQIAMNSGNAYSGGSRFVSTDGAWAQGSTTEDFAFRVNAAKFSASRTVVEFDSITLEGGMSEIDMIYQAWEPAATRLVWEVSPVGMDVWFPLDDRDPNPLAGLPNQVRLRATFLGTEDVQPAINLDTYARVISGRLRPDMRALTEQIDFGFATTAASLVINMDNFDPVQHSIDAKLVVNGGLVNAASITPTPDPAKPGRVKFVCNYTFASATSAVVRVNVETDDVINVPFVQDIQLNGF